MYLICFLGPKFILGHESTWEIEVKRFIYKKCSPLTNPPWPHGNREMHKVDNRRPNKTSVMRSQTKQNTWLT